MKAASLDREELWDHHSGLLNEYDKQHVDDRFPEQWKVRRQLEMVLSMIRPSSAKPPSKDFLLGEIGELMLLYRDIFAGCRSDALEEKFLQLGQDVQGSSNASQETKEVLEELDFVPAYQKPVLR